MAEPRGWRRRLGTAALVALAVTVGGAANAYMPSPSVQQRPFIRTGHEGDRVDARTIDVQLLGVRGAAIVRSGGAPHDTTGVWVIVKLRVTAHIEPVQLGQAMLRDGDGRLFRSSGRINDNPPLRQLQPGMPVDCEIAFEIPKNAPLPIAARVTTALIDIRMDGLAELELELKRGQLEQWAADQTPLTLMRPILAASDQNTEGTTGTTIESTPTAAPGPAVETTPAAAHGPSVGKAATTPTDPARTTVKPTNEPSAKPTPTTGGQ